MLMLQFPANANLLTNAVSIIINLDLLDPDFLSNLILNFSIENAILENPEYEVTEENEEVILIAQIQNQGYETYHPILNLGGIFVIISMFLIKTVVFLVLKLATLPINFSAPILLFNEVSKLSGFF